MALEKLKILVSTNARAKPLRFKEGITALFNPSQIAISKSVTWGSNAVAQRDVPDLRFTHGNAATLNIDLFFDTYEAKTDVRYHTQEVLDLAMVSSETHAPPVCQLVWGKTGAFFQGVLTSLNQSFTLFLADGTAVRATLTCTFTEFSSYDEQERLQNKKSADVYKTRTIRRGDTLTGIAGELYDNPALWRAIAEANAIDNPRVPRVGQTLAIPAIRRRRLARS